MLVKVIAIISVSMSMCVGNIFPHVMQDHPPSQATSSVHFERQDVPLSYKYSSYHPRAPIYQKNEKTQLSYQQERTPSPVNIPSIQYAPLINPEEIQVQNTKFNKVHFYNSETRLLDPNPTPKKNTKHLEPKFEEIASSLPSVHDYQAYPLTHLDYIPGHNIEVLRSVNRSPGHNAVYRSYTDRIPKDEIPNKVNHLNQYIIHPKQRLKEDSTGLWINVQTLPTTSTTPSTTTTTTTFPTTTTTTTPKPTPQMYNYLSYNHPNKYYIPKPVAYIVEKPMTLEKSPFTKMHTLLLNVGRSYNSASAPHRATHAGASPSLLGKLHDHTPLKNADKRTVLYPAKKNLHFPLHS